MSRSGVARNPQVLVVRSDANTALLDPTLAAPDPTLDTLPHPADERSVGARVGAWLRAAAAEPRLLLPIAAGLLIATIVLLHYAGAGDDFGVLSPAEGRRFQLVLTGVAWALEAVLLQTAAVRALLGRRRPTRWHTANAADRHPRPRALAAYLLLPLGGWLGRIDGGLLGPGLGLCPTPATLHCSGWGILAARLAFVLPTGLLLVLLRASTPLAIHTAFFLDLGAVPSRAAPAAWVGAGQGGGGVLFDWLLGPAPTACVPSSRPLFWHWSVSSCC